MRKKTNIHPATNPSDPSIKFVKFITAVIKITKKIKIKIFNIGLNTNKLILLNLRIRREVKSWKRYLYFGDTFIKSSKILINIKGIHNKDNGTLDSKFLKKANIKSWINIGIIKDTPPALGIGLMCKLLLLGVSRKNNWKNLNPFFKIKKEENKPNRKYPK